MKVLSIALLLSLFLFSNSSFAQYDSISFDIESFETIWIESFDDENFINDLRLTSDNFKYSNIQFYDLNSDSKNEALVWWNSNSFGAKVKWKHAGLVIFDIKNSKILFDELYNDCIEDQIGSYNPDTKEISDLEEASCCRDVTFSKGYFEFGEIMTLDTDGIEVDYACPSIIQIEQGSYKFDGVRMVKTK